MEPYIGEIRLFAGNFAPRGWAFCEGQQLGVAQNQALFAVLSNRFGGDGQLTFALPDLRGRVPVGTGAGAGLSPRAIGEVRGTATVPLSEAELPAHTHDVALAMRATSVDPLGAAPAVAAEPTYAEGPGAGALAPEAVTPAGDGLPHENRQPYLAVHYIIALQGLFPARE